MPRIKSHGEIRTTAFFVRRIDSGIIDPITLTEEF
jgi:hypothetical protein